MRTPRLKLGWVGAIGYGGKAIDGTGELERKLGREEPRKQAKRGVGTSGAESSTNERESRALLFSWGLTFLN